MVAAKKKQNSVKQEESFTLLARGIIGGVFLILGFLLSYGSFFRDNPLYGVKFLGEFLISLTSAAIGFFLIPMAFFQVKSWLEDVIKATVSAIVGDFWEQQTDRINKKKKEKEQEKVEEERRKMQEKMENSVLVDTSVLIDGRILDIVKTGFFDKVLIVPTAVMNELHLVSDNKNKLKRERGRRGLDIVKKLKSSAEVVIPKIKSDLKEVDKILLEFAKENDLELVTLDFNLNKLADAQGVKVLNINELVEAVKLSVLPGETLEIEIQHEGKSKNQGVGYMPDGTMAVVKGGDELIGEKVKVKVLKVIQSKAGKIIFTDLVDKDNK
jgi:uncharacterized protein YacL